MKKVFKKCISLTLSLALILSTLVGAVSVTADTTPTVDDGKIHATPLRYVGRTYAYVEGDSSITNDVSTIPGFTTVGGHTVNYVNEKVVDYAAESVRYLGPNISDETTSVILTDSIGLMFYVKFNTDNALAPMFSAGGKEMHLDVGETVMVRALNENQWTEKTSQIAYSKNSTLRGGIEFDAGFEGFVKIPYSAFSNDGNKNAYKPDVDVFTTFLIRFKKIGGQYGGVTVGPLMKVTQDSASTTAKIEIPEEYRPAPISAYALKNDFGVSRQSTYFTLPIKTVSSNLTDAKGITINKAGTALNLDDTKAPYGGWAAFTPMNEVLTTPKYFIFYLKIDEANTVYPTIQLKANAEAANVSKWSTPNPNKSYYTLDVDGDTWIEHKTITSVKNDGTNFGDSAAMNFTEAFEGYVMISFKNMGYNVSAGNVITDITYRFTKNNKSIVVGPNFIGTNDSLSSVISVENGNSAIEAKDIDVTKNNGGATRTLVTPIPDVTVNSGVKVSRSSETTGEEGFASKNQNWTALYFESKLTDAEALMFYVKTDSANKISFKLQCKENGGTEMQLRVGANYQTLALGATEWETSSAVKGMTNNELIGGAMTFDSAFEGYVKIPIGALVHDGGTVYDPTNETYDLYALCATLCIKDLGGKYGTVTLGPIFNVTHDSYSADINIAETDFVAKAITGYTYGYCVNMKTRVVRPEGLNAVAFAAKSWKYSGTDEALDYSYNFNYYDVSDEGYATCEDENKFDKGVHYTQIVFADGKVLGDMDSIMFYVKTETANAISPTMGIKDANGKSHEMGIKVGSSYQILPIGADKWTQKTAETCKPNNNFYGLMRFEEAFEGWVKIPVSNLASDNGTVYDPATHAVTSIVTRIKNFVKDKEVVIGAYFAVTEDSVSADVTANMTDAVIGDLNGDGTANATDAATLRGLILASNGNSVYDINIDGKVNVKDLVRLKKNIVA